MHLQSDRYSTYSSFEVQGRKAELPELEIVLKEKFLAIREKDYKVKKPWFMTEGQHLLHEIYKDNPIV